MGKAPEDPSMNPLLDAILEHVPAPPGDPQGQFAMLVTMTERDSFLGRVATGRIASGQVKVGDKVKVLRHNGKIQVQWRSTSIQPGQTLTNLREPIMKVSLYDVGFIMGFPAW